MFSITMHRVYIALIAAVTLGFSYQALAHLFTNPGLALAHGMYAAASSAVFVLMVRRWFHLEFLWARAMVLLVPARAKADYRERVRTSLNHVLSKAVFRREMKRNLNKKGVSKLFVHQGTPAVELDVAFPTLWNNHNYLRGALGWIATCMPASVVCQTLERRQTRLIFRFAYRDAQRKDVQGLHDALTDWKKNMQSLLVMHLDLCSMEQSDGVPASLPQRAHAYTMAQAPLGRFERDVLLAAEHVHLRIGFDGAVYYTCFAQQTSPSRREYPSWEALWSVWQHMAEVRQAFAARHPST